MTLPGSWRTLRRRITAGMVFRTDPGIEEEGEMLDVPDVEGQAIGPVEIVAAIDLGPAGEAGADAMAKLFALGVIRQIANEQGARSHEAHVAAEDVDQLRQLVQAGGAEEGAESGGALGIGEHAAVGGGLGEHRTEFHEREGGAVEAGAGLAKNHWAAEEHANGDSRKKKQGTGKNQ